jgi:hypothetical protein
MGGKLKIISALALSLAATILFSDGAFAAWQDQASRADLERLDHLPQIRAAALDQARGARGQGDARVISNVMAAEGRGIPARALMGNWRCRQLKLGGIRSTAPGSAAAFASIMAA